MSLIEEINYVRRFPIENALKYKVICDIVDEEAETNAEPERKTGWWIKDHYCSICGWYNEDVYYISGWTGNFCPNCGAKMEGAE